MYEETLRKEDFFKEGPQRETLLIYPLINLQLINVRSVDDLNFSRPSSVVKITQTEIAIKFTLNRNQHATLDTRWLRRKQIKLLKMMS